jgi:hypothetical protein
MGDGAQIESPPLRRFWRLVVGEGQFTLIVGFFWLIVVEIVCAMFMMSCYRLFLLSIVFLIIGGFPSGQRDACPVEISDGMQALSRSTDEKLRKKHVGECLLLPAAELHLDAKLRLSINSQRRLTEDGFKIRLERQGIGSPKRFREDPLQRQFPLGCSSR